MASGNVHHFDHMLSVHQSKRSVEVHSPSPEFVRFRLKKEMNIDCILGIAATLTVSWVVKMLSLLNSEQGSALRRTQQEIRGNGSWGMFIIPHNSLE
jgi:hypothetical protein